MISADEKSQLQALRRRHPGLPPAPGRVRRQEFEYHREGTLAYLAGYDVHHARVIGRCAATTGIEPFTALVEQVMTSQPYASAKRVFWVVDNGSSHNGQRSIDRMRQAWPHAELVHLPVHATLSLTGCSPSKIVTMRLRRPSTGASPASPSIGSSNASPPTKRHNPRRTNGRNH